MQVLRIEIANHKGQADRSRDLLSRQRHRRSGQDNAGRISAMNWKSLGLGIRQ
jgi:hypothetical protein